MNFLALHFFSDIINPSVFAPLQVRSNETLPLVSFQAGPSQSRVWCKPGIVCFLNVFFALYNMYIYIRIYIYISAYPVLIPPRFYFISISIIIPGRKLRLFAPQVLHHMVLQPPQRRSCPPCNLFKVPVFVVWVFPKIGVLQNGWFIINGKPY